MNFCEILILFNYWFYYLIEIMAKTITVEDRNLIIKIAKLFLDSPYQFGWNGDLPWDPTDCSRFVQVVLWNVWITVERNSAMQWEQFSSTGNMHTDLSKADVWDLVFFKDTYETENEITHVAFYMWNNEMIGASWKKVQISKIDKYWQDHFKWVGMLSLFTKDYSKTKANKNYERLSNKDEIIRQRTLKAVNAVIAVLTSTWVDLPEKYQKISADYAKKLRTEYPEARKLENDMTKKVYQSVVDMISYSRKYAWYTEQKKYEELANYLRKKFWLQ